MNIGRMCNWVRRDLSILHIFNGVSDKRNIDNQYIVAGEVTGCGCGWCSYMECSKDLEK